MIHDWSLFSALAGFAGVVLAGMVALNWWDRRRNKVDSTDSED